MLESSIQNAARAIVEVGDRQITYFSLPSLERAGLVQLSRLPFSIKVLLENALRNMDGYLVTEDDVVNVASWDPNEPSSKEFPFVPSRVLMQDFTGVPAVVDLAAMRSAVARKGGDPSKINPLVPVDLVIDHSVQVDFYGSSKAFRLNVEREFQRNSERYALLRWAQNAFDNLRIVPPGMGIVHQVNLEYLATVVSKDNISGVEIAYPDTVVGTDSHTTMINGLSVLGWGVGGIEAEAVLLGQPYYMQLPKVVGFKLSGQLREGVTATDLVLTVTQMLRQKGVVEKFVEFYGSGLSYLPLPDRATIANMAPEYGATCGIFPIDDVTLDYLRGTGRPQSQIDLVETYAKAQGMFRTDDSPTAIYSDLLELDMGMVEPSLAGPKRPQDRLALADVKENFYSSFKDEVVSADGHAGSGYVELDLDGQAVAIGHGSVVIAAITSCTNTSNPSVMVGAGLMAKNAAMRGLTTKPWVKSSMAPGSQAVTDYLNAAGLNKYLERLGYYTVGYGCTTCIGNSGPLPDSVSNAIDDNHLVVASVLSGNRNFEGRIHEQVRANYLASPMLVVAYGLAGTINIDLNVDPLGYSDDGKAVYLHDIWPSQDDIAQTIASSLNPEIYKKRYSQVFQGSAEWQRLDVHDGILYQWDLNSTYIKEVPFFQESAARSSDLAGGIQGARVLVMVGDSITTDHISPAGAIPRSRPAGEYLTSCGVDNRDFNTFGARRGNHEVMMRGTFGNVRLRNKLTPDREGDWTIHLPDGQVMSIFEAAVRYQSEEVATLVMAGKEYGTGSSRDWAAKGPALLGVRVVLAESYERIHRSNLLGMGVLPLQFAAGENADQLGLTGREIFDFPDLAKEIAPGQTIKIRCTREDESIFNFDAVVRINSPVEMDYYMKGGVLQSVLQRMMKAPDA